MTTLTITIDSGYASPRSIEFPPERSPVRIGRSADAEVRLDPQRDTACARECHARLVYTDGAWRLEAVHASGLGVVGAGGRVLRRLAAGESAPVGEGLSFELGEGGPRLRAMPAGATLPGTEIAEHGDAPVVHIPADVIAKARGSSRRVRQLAVGGVAAMAVIAMAITVTYQRGRGGAMRAIKEVAAVKEQLKEVEDGTRDRMTAVLAASAPSVWLVGARGSDGGFTPMGTAWTVAPQRLATNAHVADGLAEAWGAGHECIAIGGGSTGDEIVIGRDVLVHPAYRPWGTMLASQVAARAGGAVEHVSLIIPGDVALLEVLDGDAGTPLTLADSTASTLRPGDVVGYSGYPMENVAGLPTRQSVVGRVSALTTFFFRSSKADDTQLIHHNAVVVGGASGSPLLNAKGEVVGIVCAGSFVFTPDGQRSPVGINYAQRVDLIAEMLNGDAESAQETRDARWREEMRGTLLSPEALLNRVTDGVLSSGMGKIVLDDRLDLTAAGIDGGQGRLVQLRSGREYVAIAVADDWLDIDLFAASSGELLAKNDALDWFPMLTIDPSRSAREVTMFVMANGLVEGASCSVRLRVIEVEP